MKIKSIVSSVSAADSPERARPRWLLGCAVIAALGLLLLPVTCRLGQAGIQRNILHPPQIDISIGGARLIARTIDYAPMCDAPPDVCDPIKARGVRLYFGWVDVRLPGETSTRHYPLIAIPLEGRDAR